MSFLCVTSLPGAPVFDDEAAKAANLNAIPLSKRIDHGIEDCINDDL